MQVKPRKPSPGLYIGWFLEPETAPDRSISSRASSSNAAVLTPGATARAILRAMSRATCPARRIISISRRDLRMYLATEVGGAGDYRRAALFRARRDGAVAKPRAAGRRTHTCFRFARSFVGSASADRLF